MTEQRAEVIAAALIDPRELTPQSGSWTLDRLQSYLNERTGIPIRRARIGEILMDEGLKCRHQETWFGKRVDPDFAEKGIIERLYTAPPDGSAVVCLADGPRVVQERADLLDRLRDVRAQLALAEELVEGLPRGDLRSAAPPLRHGVCHEYS
jgi:hypothetical protein